MIVRKSDEVMVSSASIVATGMNGPLHPAQFLQDGSHGWQQYLGVLVDGESP